MIIRVPVFDFDQSVEGIRIISHNYEWVCKKEMNLVPSFYTNQTALSHV